MALAVLQLARRLTNPAVGIELCLGSWTDSDVQRGACIFPYLGSFSLLRKLMTGVDTCNVQRMQAFSLSWRAGDSPHNECNVFIFCLCRLLHCGRVTRAAFAGRWLNSPAIWHLDVDEVPRLVAPAPNPAAAYVLPSVTCPHAVPRQLGFWGPVSCFFRCSFFMV
jgi:hypothetical protein